MKTGPLLVVSLVAGLNAALPRTEQRVTLREVLERAGKYASDYRDALATVVADEEYTQELVSKQFESVLKQRRLESEVAFVRPAGTDDWLAFRSVLRVDGEPVENEPGRLDRVFKSDQPAPLEQLRRIADESARYNLGALQRNFNIPTLVLQFLLPSYQRRFKFDKRGEEEAAGRRVWVIVYEERDRPRIIRTPDNRDVQATGRIWIDPADGQVVRATLELDSPVRTHIQFEWALDKTLGLWVPSQMREHYRGRITSKVWNSLKPEEYDIRGLALYTNYRRFKTDARMK